MSGHPSQPQQQQQLTVESKYQTLTPVPPIPPYGHQMGPAGGGSYGHFAAVSQPQTVVNQSYVLPQHAYVYGNGEPLAKQMKLEPSSHVNNPAENSFPQVPAVSSTTRQPVNGPVSNMHQQQQQLPHHMQPQSQQQQQLSHQQPPQQPLQPQQQQQQQQPPHHPHPHQLHPHAQPPHNQHHMTVPVMHQQLVHHQQPPPHQQTVVPSLPLQQQQPAPITNNNDWDQSQTLAGGGGSLSPGGDSSNGNEKSAKKKRKRCGECGGCLKKDNCGDCGPCKSVRSHQICKMRKCDQLKTKKEKARESKNQTAQSASATAQGNTSGITTTTTDASPETPVNGLRDVSSPPNHRSTPVLNGGSSGPFASESNAQLHATAAREPPLPPQPPIPQQQHPTADMNGGGDVANRHQIMNNRLKTMIQNRQNNKTNFESYQNFCNGNQRPPSQNGIGDPFHTSAPNGNNNLNGGLESHDVVNGGGDTGSNGGMDDQQRLHHQQQQQSQYEQDQQSFLLNTTTSSNISISTASTMMMSSYDGEYYGHDMDVECGRSLTQFDSGSTGTSLLDLSDSVVHRYDHTSTTVPPLPPVSTLMMPGWWSS